jgi:hypothetical protein
MATAIEGIVWEDQNRNGRQDGGEPGMPGMKVTLDPVTVQALEVNEERTVITDSDGYYRFGDVTAGMHVVQVEEVVGGWPTTDPVVEVSVALYQTVLVNFGFYRGPVMVFLPVVAK